jgi:hypothetical protein
MVRVRKYIGLVVLLPAMMLALQPNLYASAEIQREVSVEPVPATEDLSGPTAGQPAPEEMEAVIAAARVVLGDRFGIPIVGPAGEIVIRGIDLTETDLEQIRSGSGVRSAQGRSTYVLQAELMLLKAAISNAIEGPVGTVGHSIGLDLVNERIVVGIDSPDLAFVRETGPISLTDERVLSEPLQDAMAAAWDATLQIVRALGLDERRASQLGDTNLRDVDVASELVRLTVGSVSETDARHDPPVQGAEWLKNPDGSRCTAGFIFTTGYSSSSQVRVSSAGHCARFVGNNWVGDVGVDRKYYEEEPGNGMTDEYIGHVTNNYYKDEGTDVSLFTLPSSQIDRSRVFTSSNTYRNITGIRSLASQAALEQQCYAGFTSAYDAGHDTRCGQLGWITDWHPTGAPTGWYLRDLRCLERRTLPGDSGGPVYFKSSSSTTQALGTVVGEKDIWIVTTQHYTCYEPIQDILSASGYILKTK